MIQQQGRQKTGVPVTVIFITDGQSENSNYTAKAAELFHEMLPEVCTIQQLLNSEVLMHAMLEVNNCRKNVLLSNNFYQPEGIVRRV